MKVEELCGRSLPRNPLLFGLMQRISLVEKIGSGLMRIQNAMKEYDLPCIEFEADENWFKIIFRRSEEETAGQDKEPGEEIREKTRKKILNLIREYPEISLNDIAKNIDITKRQAELHLNKLKEENIIMRVGSRRGGYWKIII